MKETQTSKLVNYLLQEKDHWISSALLSDYLSVSTRQIRKYVAALNQNLDRPLIISSNRGYRIDMDVYTNYRLSHNNEETPATRVSYIIQKLVSEKDGYDVFDLADELYVSIATIENDLRNVRQQIKEYHLKLKREKDIISMIGSELNKRNLMSRLISSDSYDNFVLQDEVRLLTFHYHFWDFRSTIRDIFALNDIFVNDYTLNNTALHLIIMIDRIRNHCEIEEDIDLDKLRSSQQYHVAEQIKDYIENEYDIIICDAELYNLTLVISNNTSMIDYSFITPQNINQYIEQKYIDITRKVLHDVETCYCLDAFDEDFIAKFTIHVKNLFNRINNHYYAKNPLTSKIKTSFPLIYDIAVYIAQEFKTEYQVTLTEDEITFVAFHIGSFFENNVQSKSKVICAFIYADYYSTHKNIMDKLIRRFEGQINMKYAISINNFNDDLRDVDLIISTIDIPLKTEHVIIHPFLTEKDARNINKAINRVAAKKKNHALKTYLTNFFDEQLFYKNPPFTNKEDTIRKLSEDLCRLEYAKPSLYEDVMAREKMSSTAFHDVAVPHSLTKSANLSFVSIVISEEPIPWDNHFVHIVALIGVNEDSRKVFSEVFDALIDILSDPYSVKELIQSNNFHSFIQCLKDLMDRNYLENYQ